jgi:hypothetical protein
MRTLTLDPKSPKPIMCAHLHEWLYSLPYHMTMQTLTPSIYTKTLNMLQNPKAYTLNLKKSSKRKIFVFVLVK